MTGNAYYEDIRPHMSRIEGSNAAIWCPTAWNTSGPWAMGSWISSHWLAGSAGRNDARSAVLCGSNCDTSADASASAKVHLSLEGSICKTASRCARVIVRIKSAWAATRAVSCRAAKSEGLPPSASNTLAASWCIGCAMTARVPALEAAIFAICRRSQYSTVRRSAIGDRQIFPVHTNKRCRADSSFMIRDAGLEQTAG